MDSSPGIPTSIGIAARYPARASLIPRSVKTVGSHWVRPLLTSALAILGLFSLNGLALVGILVVSGVSNTAALPVMTLVLMETPGVGRRHIGAAAGLFFTVAQVGGFTGPLFLGLLRDLTGTLTSGLVMLTVVSGVVSMAAFLIIEKRQEQ